MRKTETLAEENLRRNRCRTGLSGLMVQVQGLPNPVAIDHTGWNEKTELVVVLNGGHRVMASECVLLSKWPVVCCRPGRRKVAARS